MVKSICTQSAMLKLLRENRPAAVFSLPDEDYIVITRVDPDTLAPTDGLAVVERVSNAGKLLDAAFQATMFDDLSTWRTLPLRYGPFECMWVLAEEPFAPLSPSALMH
jgi:hypothetical protein